MHAELIQDTATFQTLRHEWGELLEGSRANTLFLTWEWLYTWWKHLAGRRQLHIVLVRNGRELVAIAPLAKRPAMPHRLIPFGALEFLGTGTVGSNYLDVIIRRGMEDDAVHVLAEFLSPGKHVLDLVQLDRGNSTSARALAGHMAEWNWNSREATFGVCPFINLSDHSWESYLATIGHEYRRNFRRRSRQLNERFAVRFEVAMSEDQRREALEALLALHDQRWQGRGGSDAFHTINLRAFHDELSQLALQRGWLRFYLLRLDRQPAASIYGFAYDHRFYFYQQGFDPRYARYSLGLVMTGLTIKEAINEGAKEYDFLGGDEEFKFHWATGARELERIDLFPPGLRGLCYREMLKLNRATTRMAWRVLPKPLVRRIASGRVVPTGNGRSAAATF